MHANEGGVHVDVWDKTSKFFHLIWISSFIPHATFWIVPYLAHYVADFALKFILNTFYRT